jgi:cytochrome c oxidase assembly protein subunit 11
MSEQQSTPQDNGSDNKTMVRKLIVIIAVMFAFGWALIPIYRKICEVTGINILAWDAKMGPDAVAEMKNTQIDTSRKVSVEFDANVQGPWRMVPTKNAISVHPGELITVMYEIANQQPRAVSGQAIPSYAPMNSAQHFHKMECFCFSQHTLAANEVKQFPVTFVVDADLPRDVANITLSFTFFEVGGAASSAQAPASSDKRS